ncbi:MAG: CDP-alcohol phosphatidyltransferase family protein [Pseudarcicella sp.]|nr:CDP-alcohol phosphatidyltransferase family protein [Pseudarcicella sp.]
MIKSITKHIPNALTCANLLCGIFGILYVSKATTSDNSNLLIASYLILAALIFDWLDGFVARLLHVTSAIGKELDSLADMVTFGVLPSFIMLSLIEQSCQSGFCTQGLFGFYKPYIAFALAVFSALRLANFNVDTRQATSFIGVPTPANGMVVASLPLIIHFYPQYSAYVLNPTVLYVYSILMSYLLVAELPLFALKFKDFSWKNNQLKYVFVSIAVLMLLFLKVLAIPLIIFLYILVSVFAYLTKK